MANFMAWNPNAKARLRELAAQAREKAREVALGQRATNIGGTVQVKISKGSFAHIEDTGAALRESRAKAPKRPPHSKQKAVKQGKDTLGPAHVRD